MLAVVVVELQQVVLVVVPVLVLVEMLIKMEVLLLVIVVLAVVVEVLPLQVYRNLAVLAEAVQLL
jgi:hypothetical protein